MTELADRQQKGQRVMPLQRSLSGLAVALTGLLALAVAMGIGRFAFTPLLPLMLEEEQVGLAGASWLASANYLGYLFGALLCMLLPVVRRRVPWRGWPSQRSLIRTGLLFTAALTLGMAAPWPALWSSLRFLAGVASAVVFVFTSGWCLSTLEALDKARLGGVIYAGPGLGIAVSGLLVVGMHWLDWPAASGWVLFGCLALLLGLSIWPAFNAGVDATPASAAPSEAVTQHSRPALAGFALAYGLAGFGYIVTATFLPVIARQAMPGSPWLDFFWPLFGLGVALGALLATRIAPRFDWRDLLAVSYLLQALGVILAVWLPSVAGFALGSILVGVPFTAITLFAMQEARRLFPQAPAGFMGLITASYGCGQVLGPPLVAWLLVVAGDERLGLQRGLETAAAALLVGAFAHFALARLHPRSASA